MVPVKNTTSLDTTSSGKLKAVLNNTIIVTLNTTVKAAGMLLLMTLRKKFPLTNSSFGSKAKTNDGIPIVNAVINVN